MRVVSLPRVQDAVFPVLSLVCILYGMEPGLKFSRTSTGGHIVGHIGGWGFASEGHKEIMAVDGGIKQRV